MIFNGTESTLSWLQLYCKKPYRNKGYSNGGLNGWILI